MISNYLFLIYSHPFQQFIYNIITLKYTICIYTMGIYPSGLIYGVRMYKVFDNEAHNLFEKTYDTQMSYEDKREARSFYKALTDFEKNKLRFQIYTLCSSPCEDDFMIWYPISLDIFKEKFFLN